MSDQRAKNEMKFLAVKPFRTKISLKTNYPGGASL